MNNRQNRTLYPLSARMQPLKAIFLSTWLCCAFCLSAQTSGVTFTAGNAVASPGSQVCVPLTVDGFDCIVEFQFSLSWDPQVLHYQSVQGFSLPDFNATNFGGNHDAGILTLAWYDHSPTLSGVDLTDGATLFEACFTVIGADGSNTPLVIGPTGFTPGSEYVEAINCSWDTVWTSTTPVNGLVSIQSASPVLATGSAIADELLQIAPNPFSSGTNVVFTLSQSGPVQLRVLDVSGKVVLEEKRTGISGENKLTIAGDQLPAEGYYQVIIQTAERQFSGSICYLKK